ncbi:hypothetical protein [Kangiella koreensis]|uniref:ApeA N-terminal domain-containing protein n=1 Tax=Kangiella koreensis (strain DSM 16069 / JCM 12317 / KCTC 12182 / SW-125) TaxID=523791 RepID=C7R7J3_KANKD|nr:hypothetical protein [Kangiella koreensis]ACV25742.1 hypothetical protein Kkor_0321 [Kangiella koreensis DSM 16069]
MSVFNLTGKGELHCKKSGSVAKVKLKISPVNGRTRLHCSPLQPNDSFSLAKLAFSHSEIALKNVYFSSAAGVLSADHLSDVYINYLTSVDEQPPQLITQLTKPPDNEHTLNLEAAYLELPRSILQVELEVKQSIEGYQLMFIGAAQSLKAFKTKIILGNQSIKIKSFGNCHPTLAGIIVAEFNSKLNGDNETALRISLELYLRQKLSFLAEIGHNKVNINLIDHSTVSYSPLNNSPQHSFQKIKNFVIKNPSYRTYFRFLVELAGNSGVIDDRLQNGFVALEALFDGNKLRKEKVSEKLKVSIGTAELIVELRNKMFHYGESIAETVQIVSREKQVHTKSPLRPIIDELKDNTDLSWVLYSGFTDLMFMYFAELVGLGVGSVKRWCPVNLRDDDWYKKLKVDQ